MSQNLVDLTPTPQSLASIDDALATLTNELSGLIGLTDKQRRGLPKMGDQSEAFCRTAATVFAQYPDVLPRNFAIDEFQRDLATFDALRPRLLQLERLYQRVKDTQMALGSDLMTAAMEGYAVLKVAGKGEGLDEARRALGARFAKRGKRSGAASE